MPSLDAGRSLLPTPSSLARAVGLAALLSGCGGASAGTPPRDTARAYAEAVRRGDAESVYALLDAETRAGLTLEQLRAQLAESPEELREQAAAVDAALADPQLVQTRARVPLRSGQHAVLVIESDRWRLVGTLLDSVSLATPEDAVMAFRSALARRSLPSITRILARAPRAEIDAQIERFLEDTEDEPALDVDIQDNEATVRTPSGRVIRMVREAGEWHVVSVE
ncbi:MAG: hypothetical protein R3B40_19925 [Polyangiales bacterium]|nr:hypothetical protein [Myxococcales bacterium]MCB9659395.1 hypothetical protein [Sandaracinaceae bacterium]